MKSPAERFWSRVRVTDSCWWWMGKRNSDGYGEMTIDFKVVKTHRFSWRLHFGSDPGSLMVCHTCDNPACVNPGHLFLGTQADNMRDMARKGRGVYPDRKGEQIPWAKLTESQVRAIRADSRPQRIVAKEYGISQPLVSMVKTRKVWDHI